ncbi:MAG: hypothetical protein EXQ93_00495 [Alphaproteobacteria bacterium]|nr:hypothetical protein [Alphaproteobacteria bacterium]
MRPFTLIAFATATLIAASALAQTAPALAARQAAAIAMRADVAAGKVVLTDEYTDWRVTCRTAQMAECSMRSTLLTADGPRTIALAAAVSYARPGEPTLTISAPNTVPDFATAQIDTLPAVESTGCIANACTFTGPDAKILIEEFLTGATVLVRYVALTGVFEGRVPLDMFVAKHTELLAP